MTLNLPSKHRPLFSQGNFFDRDESEEPQRKRQRTENSGTIPESLHFNGTESESSEIKSNDNEYVRLFDNETSPNSSRAQSDVNNPTDENRNSNRNSITNDSIPVIPSPVRSSSRGATLSPIPEENDCESTPVTITRYLSQRSQLSDVSGLIEFEQDLADHDSSHSQFTEDLMGNLDASNDETDDPEETADQNPDGMMNTESIDGVNPHSVSSPSPAPSINSNFLNRTNQKPNHHNHRSPAFSMPSMNSIPSPLFGDFSNIDHSNSLLPPNSYSVNRPLESLQISNEQNQEIPRSPTRSILRTPNTAASSGNRQTVTPPDHPSSDLMDFSMSSISPAESAPKQRPPISENAVIRHLNSGSLTPNVHSATHYAPTPSTTGTEMNYEEIGEDLDQNLDDDFDENLDENLSDHPSDQDIMPQMDNQPGPIIPDQDTPAIPPSPAMGHCTQSPRQRMRRHSDPLSLRSNQSPNINHHHRDRPLFGSRSGRGSNSNSKSNRSSPRRVSPQKSTGSCVRNPGDRRQYVLCITEYRNRKEIGAAAIDLTAPRILLYQFTDKAAYTETVSLITMLSPKTILHPSRFSDRSTGFVHCISNNEGIRNQHTELRPVQRKYFNDSEAVEHLKEICAPEALRKVNLSDNALFLALSSCNAALHWLNLNGPRFAPRTVTLEHQSIAGYMKLDFESIKNLELVANLKNPRSRRGTLYQALDHCKTKMGQRMLRSTLYQPLSQRDAIQDRQVVVEILRENEDFYNYCVGALSSFNDQDSINNALSRTPRGDVSNFNTDGASKFLLSVLALQANLKLLPGLVQALNAHKGESNLLIQYHDMLSDHEYPNLLNVIGNTIDSEHEYGTKMSIQRQRNAVMTTVKTGISGELDTAKRLYYDVQHHIESQFEAYQMCRETNIPGMRLHYTASRGFHVCIPAAHRNRLQSPQANNLFIERQRKKKNVYCTTSSIKTLNHSLDQTFADIMRYSQNVILGLLSVLQSKMSLLHILSECVAELDMLTAFATYSSKGSTRMVKPKIINFETGMISMTQSKHPILEHLGQNKVVGNNVSIALSNSLQIVNGPNGAGKSTYIKQAALLCIMAHIGCFLPAQFATIKALKQIFSRINVSDNMHLNESSFYRECKDMNYILNHCDTNSLVIIDELGRSTSSIDAYSFAWACCEKLRGTKAYTLFATHFDLSKLVRIYPDVTSYTFKMKMDRDKIKYSYRLHDPQQNDHEDVDDGQEYEPKHYGIIMAEMTGFPTHIIGEANSILQEEDIGGIQECEKRSEFEMALSMREHTESIRGSIVLEKDQIIEIIDALKAQLIA